jgi:DNA-binding ferritin-like protein
MGPREEAVRERMDRDAEIQRGLGQVPTGDYGEELSWAAFEDAGGFAAAHEAMAAAFADQAEAAEEYRRWLGSDHADGFADGEHAACGEAAELTGSGPARRVLGYLDAAEVYL